MALKTVVDSMDDVPEALQAEYVEQDGKFVLRIDGIDDHPAVVNLKTAHERTKTKNKALTDELTAAKSRLEGLPEDFDAETYEELRTAAEGKEPPKTDEQVARVREQLERKHQAELAKERAERERLDGLLRKRTVDDALGQSLMEASVDQKFLAASKALLKDRVKVTDEDGDYVAVVETDMGPMPLKKYVADWAGTDEGKVFVSKPTGGDARGGTGQRFAENPFDDQGGKVKPNRTKQQEAILANPEKARQMAIAAGHTPNW